MTIHGKELGRNIFDEICMMICVCMIVKYYIPLQPHLSIIILNKKTNSKNNKTCSSLNSIFITLYRKLISKLGKELYDIIIGILILLKTDND